MRKRTIGGYLKRVTFLRLEIHDQTRDFKETH